MADNETTTEYQRRLNMERFEELMEMRIAIGKIKLRHSPRDETKTQTITYFRDGEQKEHQIEQIVCDWCQYLLDNDDPYKTERVAVYPCLTIVALGNL